MIHDDAAAAASTQDAPRPRRARPSWWRSNRLWLLAMPVLLALALLASTQRLVSVYLPWDQTRPLSATDNMVHYRQRYKQIDEWFERDVRVRLVAMTAVDEFGSVRAADGAQLWRVDLELRADPDQVLDLCTVELVADGTHYGNMAGQVAINEQELPAVPNASCDPPDAPGPHFEPYSTTIIPPESPRPDKWQRAFAFAVPKGVTPTEFRLWWNTPEYAVFTVKPS